MHAMVGFTQAYSELDKEIFSLPVNLGESADVKPMCGD